MRDFRFRRLQKLRVGGTDSKMQLSVPAPKSPTGKVYQECPDTQCSPRLFQLGDAPAERAISEEHRHLIGRDPGLGQTICPYCGRPDDDDRYVSAMDIEAAKDRIAYDARRDVQDSLGDLARDFNRKMSGGFISMKMTVRSGPSSPPAPIREDLLRDLTCGVCQRTYGVYAIALYCPDCGAPALAAHFLREMELVRKQTDLASQIEEEDPELAYRLLGNAHEDVLTAFETAQKITFRHLVLKRLPERYEELGGQKVIGNAFQNIDRSRTLFANLSLDPFASLSEDEQEVLQLNIQKRHVIGHNLSLADDRYLALAGDSKPGQTIRLLRDDVDRFAEVVSRAVEYLDRQLQPQKPIP